MSSLIAQYVIVGIAVVMAAVWAVRRVMRRGRCRKDASEASSCDGCELAEHCRSKGH